MKKPSIMISTAALLCLIAALKVTIAEETLTPVEEVKTVGWYVANINQAKQQNKLCYNNPELKTSANCENALHALQISFVGNN